MPDIFQINCLKPLNNVKNNVLCRSYRRTQDNSGRIFTIADPDKYFIDTEPALHRAIRSSSSSAIEELINSREGINQRNELGETALHIACCVQSIEWIEVLLGVPGIDVCAVDKKNQTPLHHAVTQPKSSANILQLLIDHGALIDHQDNKLLTPIHLAIMNGHSECVDALLWAGADISAIAGKNGPTAMNMILGKYPESFQIFRRKLDLSIRIQQPTVHNRECQIVFNFDLLLPSIERCETGLVNVFILEHQKDLLSHPLVMAFLHLKWQKIRKLFLMRIFLYALTTFFLTAYVLSALAYKCYNLDETHSSKICTSKRSYYYLFQRHIIEAEWYLAFTFAIFMVPRMIFGFSGYKSVKQYLVCLDNILDSIVIASILITSFIFTGRTYDWQNYVGALATLCAWANLMLMVGQLPAFGTYVAMFTHIQLEFAKLLFAYSGLLIGFTISFCVILPREPSFGNPFTGLIKVLAMMAGEFDYDELIDQEDLLPDGSFVIHHPLPQILYTLFIVFVTVVLMNLLVGIAVHDIQGLRKHANLTKLVRQTKLIISTEMILVDGKIPRIIKKWFSDENVRADNTRNSPLTVKLFDPFESGLTIDIITAAYDLARRNAELRMIDDKEIIPFSDVQWEQEENEREEFLISYESFSELIETTKNDIKTIRRSIVRINKVLRTIVNNHLRQKYL